MQVNGATTPIVNGGLIFYSNFILQRIQAYGRPHWSEQVVVMGQPLVWGAGE